jgi:hypothetical protein
MLEDIRGMVIESNGYALHNHGTSPREMVQSIESRGLTVYEVAEGTLRRIGHPIVQPETIVDYVAVRKELNLPPGWVERPRRGNAAKLTALMDESQHPIKEHRDYADRTVQGLSRKLSWQYRRMLNARGAR